MKTVTKSFGFHLPLLWLQRGSDLAAGRLPDDGRHAETALCGSLTLAPRHSRSQPTRAMPAPFGFNSSTSSNGDDVSLSARGETAAATRLAGLEWECFVMRRSFSAETPDR